jgi:hypothetical protein
VIKVRLVCDSCGGVIADGLSANQVRFQARALYRTREHKDYCLICAAHGRELPSVPQKAASHPPLILKRAPVGSNLEDYSVASVA